MLILTNRGFWDSKSLYDSWSSRSKNLASQLERHNDAGNLDQSIRKDTAAYYEWTGHSEWQKPGRTWLNRPMIQAIIPLRRLRYDIGTLQAQITCTCSGGVG